MKALGVEWNVLIDHFRLATTDFASSDKLTKRALVSDIAKTYEVLGWFSPASIIVKILLQCVWEEKYSRMNLCHQPYPSLVSVET